MSGDSGGGRLREAFLGAVREGRGVGDARVGVGWSVRAYAYHRKRYPEWAARVDAARRDPFGELTRATVGGVGGVPSGFADFVTWAWGRVHHAGQLRLADELGVAKAGEVVLFLTWRGAGKTTTVEHYVMRKLALEPDHRFCIVSRADSHSKKMVENMKRMMTDTGQYPEFVSRFGPFYEQGQERRGFPWSKYEVRVANRKDSERDPNIAARAWTSAAFGSRIDTLIVDDVIDRRNVNESGNILEVLQQTYFSSEREMRVVIVGNRIAPGDLYDQMIEAGIITRKVILPAAGGMGADALEPTVPEAWASTMIRHDGQVCCFARYRELCRELGLPAKCPEDGSLLTPQQMMVRKRAQVGERVWHATFQQAPTANELSTFAGLIDRCLDRDRSIGLVAA